MSTIPEKDLPAPRLELRYREAAPEDGFDPSYPTVCEYNFVFPLGKYDKRAEYHGPRGAFKFGHYKTNTVRINLSATSASLDSKYDRERDEVDTPFRDGAHIQWDAPHFGNPPMFAVAQGRAMLIKPMEAEK